MIMVKRFVVAFIIFLVIDMIWLGLIAKNLYTKYLGYIMADTFNMAAAMLFYVLFVIGLCYFVINPAIAANSIKMVIGRGVFFGLITYATYDLTNLATLKDWPITITVIDLMWGMTLSGSVSFLSYLILNR